MRVDVLTLADPRFPGGTSTAVAAELAAQHRFGYRSALLAVKGDVLRFPHPFHTDIRQQLDAGHCLAVDPTRPIDAQLALIHHPQILSRLPLTPLAITCRQAVIVTHHPPLDGDGKPAYDAAAIDRHATAVTGRRPIWAPIGPRVRAQLDRLDAGLDVLAHDWHNVLDPAAWPGPRQGPLGPRPIIGRHSRPDTLKWPATRDEVLALYPETPDVDVRVLGGGAYLETLIGTYPRNWTVLPFGAQPTAAFLGGIDFFVYYHHPRWIEGFGRAIIEALASGCVAVLPPDFRPLFADAAVYAPPEHALSVVRRLHADARAFSAQSRRGHDAVMRRFAMATHARRLREVIGVQPSGAIKAPPPEATAEPVATRPVMMMSSNGVGLGHLSRLLAIATRLGETPKAVFVTMSQALRVVEEEGFLAEFVPFHVYLEAPSDVWNRHLAADLHELFGFYRPSVLVFDGNTPYQGLLDALAAFPEIVSIWSRRGFWRATNTTEALERETAFDLVIEPGDLADAVDDGPTRRHRSRTRPVAPIRLVDGDAMVSTADAKAALRLDPRRRAVLLQLGSGNNADTAPVARLVAELTAPHADVELVHIRNPISIEPPVLPSSVTVRSVYPLGRYLRAFDAAISAVGYNSFHELLLAGCPTLFVPNEHPSMDDQLARALYAERSGWALCGRAHRVVELHDKLQALLEPSTRSRLRARLARLSAPNGAIEAAAIIREQSLLCRADRPMEGRA